MAVRRARLWCAVVVVALVTASAVVIVPSAQAFKPYTHSNSGFDARADAVDNGNVTINGREYPVNPAVVAALRQWPTYYNAGVIGPDGFPDLTMGQSIIHPIDTGRWLKYLLDRAWAAQTDPGYSPDEKGQILAFAYGFLTHAAGDTWAHTLINELSGGVFPTVGGILTSPAKASIAIRHIIAEGYVGDATRGFDGNPDRTTLPGGDVSDDSTPGIRFDSPNRFIYETLVRPDTGSPGAPSTARGPLIDFFVGLRSSLQKFVTTNPQPIQAALNNFNFLKNSFASIEGDCAFDELSDLYDCPADLIKLGFDVAIASANAFHDFVLKTLEAAGKVVLNAYAYEWIHDIDDGLRHWGELGLTSTRALFDPQARRNTQNDECGAVGSEGQLVRANCEDGIGLVDTLLHETNDFINNHLLSMLGLPDFVGGLRAFLQDFSATIDSIVGPLLNPLRETRDQLEDFAKELLKDAINDRFGIDIDQIQGFLDSPSSKMDLTTVNLAPFGTIGLFAPDAHAKLDAYLHLPPGHHTGVGGGLGDNVEFDPTQFAAYRNTVTTAKLLLLDGPVLDQVLSDLSGHPYHLYGNEPHGNIMTTTLPVAGSDQTEWLKLIDGDHAWRADGLPKFGPGAFEHPIAGNGNMPIWESCVLRPTFRSLFTDWENGAENFPPLGDDTSTDPNDPNAPVSTLTIGNPKFVNGGNTYVSGATPLTLGATDDFFASGEIGVDVRVRAGGATGGAFTTVAPGATLSLTGQPDGPIHVDLRAHDPCRAEAVHAVDLVLDTAPPVVTYSQPALAQYTTDQVTSIQYSVSDPGSGVASSSVTFDGAPATNGQVLDAFFLDAGLHTIVVTATDNVGNTGTTPRTFRVRATAASLLNNLDRARLLGLIPGPGAYNGARAQLLAANRSHDKGKHSTEWHQLGAFINHLQAQEGKGIDTATAIRFIGYAQDLIASRG